MNLFSKAIFDFYELAQSRKFEKGWLDKNIEMYQQDVKKPFLQLKELLIIGQKDSSFFESLKLSRPKRPASRFLDKGEVKNFTTLSIHPPKNNRYDHVPEIHFQLGFEKEDNYLFAGFRTSSKKEINLFREALDNDLIKKIKMIENRLGPLQGDKYKRQQNAPSKKLENFYQYKTFYFKKIYKRAEIYSSSFEENILRDFESASLWFKLIKNITHL